MKIKASCFRCRAKRGLMLFTSSKQKQDKDYDVGFICPEHFEEFKKIFPATKPVSVETVLEHIYEMDCCDFQAMGDSLKKVVFFRNYGDEWPVHPQYKVFKCTKDDVLKMILNVHEENIGGIGFSIQLVWIFFFWVLGFKAAEWLF